MLLYSAFPTYLANGMAIGSIVMRLQRSNGESREMELTLVDNEFIPVPVNNIDLADTIFHKAPSYNGNDIVMAVTFVPVHELFAFVELDRPSIYMVLRKADGELQTVYCAYEKPTATGFPCGAGSQAVESICTSRFVPDTVESNCTQRAMHAYCNAVGEILFDHVCLLTV